MQQNTEQALTKLLFFPFFYLWGLDGGLILRLAGLFWGWTDWNEESILGDKHMLQFHIVKCRFILKSTALSSSNGSFSKVDANIRHWHITLYLIYLIDPGYVTWRSDWTNKTMLKIWIRVIFFVYQFNVNVDHLILQLA